MHPLRRRMRLSHLPWSSPSAGSSRPSVRDVHEQLTYLGLERRAAACAEQLSARSLEPGDVVAVTPAELKRVPDHPIADPQISPPCSMSTRSA